MINNQKLSAIEIDAAGTTKHCVIWLHGLGADGSDFANIVPELRLPAEMNIRFVFPHAPVMPVTVNNGYEMRAWFDIYGPDLSSKVDRDGIMQSVAQVNTLIEHEVSRGIATSNIILAGFSQGSVIAMITGVLYPQRLGGVIALSGLLPHAETVIQQGSPANSQLPMFVGHGSDDEIVQQRLGQEAYEAFAAAGYPAQWHSYPMGHSVCREEIKDISDWIQKIWK